MEVSKRWPISFSFLKLEGISWGHDLLLDGSID